ncbi:trypsin 3A1-like [Anopheles coustani]|uniref:trypsin 3A1-like n=1 Tax=Anopheles coustani TaxID=139045 RepID=UPI00265B1C97|nr:trypsin 3A1-like [Anopheles coustani]
MTRQFLFVVLSIGFIWVSIVGALESTPLPSGRIVGGSNVDISKYPYQLSLLNDGYHYCGASVVASQWALTAGHCCNGFDVLSLSIRGGSSTNNQGGVVFTVEKLVLHPSFNSNNLNYDVCMIQIKETFLGHPNIAIIPLSNSDSIPSNELGTVSGWGATQSDGNSVLQLRATKVKIFTDKSCTAATRNYVSLTNSMFCAGNVGSSICVGDSGGPLVFEQQQIGVVSFIVLECGGVAPAVYTRIANRTVRDFILQQINSSKMIKTTPKIKG